MKRRPLTARGWGCLLTGIALAVAANLVAARPLLYVAVLLILLPFLALIVAYAPRRRGDVSRQISTDLLTVGEKSQVRVRFDLYALGIPRGRWQDTLPPAVRGDASGEYPGDSALLQYRVEGVRRGVSTLGPLLLQTIDPFGLAQREQAFGDTRTVTVVPQVHPLAPLPSKVGAAGGAAQTQSNRLGQGADNLIPRVYSAGDSRRRIHWRATAHRGELMVRQEEEEASPDALVVLDRSAAHWARPSDEADPLFETAVSLCASAAVRFAQDGYSVDVVDTGGTLLGALRGHEDDRDGLLVALATLTPRGESRDLRTVIGSTPPGPLVMITGSISAGDAARLATAGAAAPMLFAASADALPAAAEHGWSTAQLPADVTELPQRWQSALPMPKAAHV